MATTPGGLPYPVGTDKVVDGDDAIHALALALDPGVIPWQTWAGSYFGLTPGNGVTTARWRKFGRTVWCSGRFVFGSTTVVTQNIYVGMPAPWSTAFNDVLQIMGNAWGQGPTGSSPFTPTPAGTDALFLRAASGAPIAPTVPWTWATGNMFTWNVTYESAA